MSKIKILHWNLGARAWENKLTEIEALLAEKKPDVAFISESNLWADLPSEDRMIPGHSLYLPDTMTSHGHARIVMIVRSEITIELLHDYMDTETATIWCKLGNTKSNSLIIGGIYREHAILGRGDTHLPWLERQRLQLWRWNRVIQNWRRVSRNARCVVSGDFQSGPLQVGKSRCWTGGDDRTSPGINIETQGFSQLITGTTRQWEGQTNSCIDHIWLNCRERVICHYNQTRGDGDHNVIGVDLACKDLKLRTLTTKKRIWKNFDKTSCLNLFKSTGWNDILDCQNVDVANSLLEDRIRTIIDKVAPFQIIQPRTKYNKFISASTKVTMVKRDLALVTAKNSGRQVDWEAFRKLRNSCTSLQRNDRSSYLKEVYKNIDAERDTAKLFATTRTLIGATRAGPPTRFLQEGKVYTKHRELAEIQAQHYLDKVNNIKFLLPRVNSDPYKFLRRAFDRWAPIGGKPTFVLRSTTLGEVQKIIDRLKNSHAYGNDFIDAFIVKIGAPVIAPIITHVINLSLGTSHFPMKWKLARVLPLLKSTDADANLPGSFRPIAQLSIISKLTERIFQTQLLTYLETTGQLQDNQHAYRQKCSTTSTLIQIMDFIAEGVDQNMLTSTLSVDQSAAFDCVDHGILLRKLKYYGITDDAHQWITSYLNFRSFYVSVGTGDSTIKNLKFGVPQGSCLGPLLYLLYVNDLPSITENDDCLNPAHLNQEKLFGEECQECGILPVFADDGLFLHRSKSRNSNLDSMISNDGQNQGLSERDWSRD